VRTSRSSVLRIADGVGWLSLPRPCVDQATAQALCDGCEQVGLDESVRVAVVQGSGSAFCRGVEQGGDWEAVHDWVAAVGALTVPVVAAVGGEAIAEGAELALACDLRVADPRASFVFSQAVRGRLPRYGATQRLPRLIGRSRALDVLLSGRHVGAREAERIGLVTQVAPRGRLAATVRQLVGALAAKGPIALRLAKEAVIKGSDLTLAQGIRLEQDLYVLLQTTADRAEGVAAFLAKRPPKFRGA
jgi:enoyl-CoA hydratase